MGRVSSGCGAGGSCGGGSGSSCCEMSLKCWCRWRWHKKCFMSSSFAFFFVCLALYGSIGALYGWLTFTHYMPRRSVGCNQDGEGSWSIGVFYGHSPFDLKPIETVNMWSDESAAWPVANPVVTCATASDAGFPSNFVADPFLYIQGSILYLFYETKNPVTLQGDIGVAKSFDKGATWQHLGIALDEEWHLSYPYIFDYHGQIYMMPESCQKGDVRLYRAINFPLQWTLEKIILKKPLVDAFIINHDSIYWLFGSDHTGFRTYKNGQLEIWYSTSPLGPYKPHKKNPIHNTRDSKGARNGGRPFVHGGDLYRVGQDCGETYGRRVRIFRIETLTREDYKETEVSFPFEESKKKRNAWNGARHHHLDAQQVGPGEWVAVMDGDRVPSGDSVRRFCLGIVSIVLAGLLVLLLGVLLGVVNCVRYGLGKRSDPYLFSSKVRRFGGRLNRTACYFRERVVKPNTWVGRSVMVLLFVSGAAFLCAGMRFVYGGSGSEDPYPFHGHLSQFTLLTMTYDARLWNLKMYVRHYSRCPSVREIVVVWNKGTAPDPRDFDSVVAVRIRKEDKNSLNNRFSRDPLIETKAVLELDDDIMMMCDDIERGFRVWREAPERIVGFYPRLIDGSPVKYRGERHARGQNGYNMILTGAAFLDAGVAFGRYWGEEGRRGREVVDAVFNCEDVLMNYLYANASRERTVEYVRPRWAVDTSKFSGAAISRNTKVHYGTRSKCLVMFSEMYGSLADRKWRFYGRNDGWDA